MYTKCDLVIRHKRQAGGEGEAEEGSRHTKQTPTKKEQKREEGSGGMRKEVCSP